MKKIIHLATMLLILSSIHAQQKLDTQGLDSINPQLIMDYQASPCLNQTQYEELTDYKQKFRTFHLRDYFKNHKAMIPFDIYFSLNGAPPFYRIHYGYCLPLSFSMPLRYQGHYFVTFNDDAQPASIHIDALTPNMKINIRANCSIHQTAPVSLSKNSAARLTPTEKKVEKLSEKLMCDFKEADLIKANQISTEKIDKTLVIDVPYQSFFPNKQTIVEIFYQVNKKSPIYRMTEFPGLAIRKMTYTANKKGIYYAAFKDSYKEDACLVVFQQEIGNKNEKKILSSCLDELK